MTVKERLKELEEARQMRQLWQERVDFLSKPIITDFSIIDELWKVTAKFKSISPLHEREYQIGERFAQIIFLPIPNVELAVVDELSDSERGTGGYGSSGL